jgi:hypothetical protein
VRAFGALFAAGLLVVPLASAATFGRPAEIPLAKAPVALALLDATQDGIDDVVLGDATPFSLTVLPGKQDGSFERPLEVSADQAPRSIASADFDNDGANELAISGASAIELYTSVDGTLARGASVTAPASSALVASDLDVDGNVDLIAGSATRAVVIVLRGLGDGTFGPPQEYAVGGVPTSLYVADLNGDELPDVVVAGSSVSVLLGNGDGTLGAPVTVLDSRDALALAGEDFDSDGDVDLAVTRRPNVVGVLFNDGEGQFSAGAGLQVGGTPASIAAADVDGDGTTDLVTANRGTNDVSLVLGREDGQFAPETRVKVGKGPVGLAIDDLDYQGANDLVTANRLSKSVTILLNGVDAPQPVVCLVPVIARKKVAVARRLVLAAHCKVASVRRKYSARVRKGRVISVTPIPRSRLPVDSPVTLLVSRGPRPKR